MTVVQAAVITILRVGVGWLLAKGLVYVLAPLPNHLPRSFTATFLHWDANWFGYIVAGGYGHDERLSTFFPVYPTTIRIAHEMTGIPVRELTLAISAVFTFFAVWGVITLAKTLWPDRPTYRAGLLLAFSPASVFLLAGYSEGAFITFAAWSFAFVAKHRPWPAAVLAALAGVSRPEGVLVGLAVVAALAHRRKWTSMIGAGAIVVSGLVSYMTFCWARFGTPFAFFEVQEHWDRYTTVPFRALFHSLYQIVSHPDVIGPNRVVTYLINDVVVIAGVVSLIWLILRARDDTRLLPFTVVAVPVVLLFVSSSVQGVIPEAAARLMMCVVPLYLIAPNIRRELMWSVLLTTSVVIAFGSQVLFNLGYWFT